MSVTNPTGPTFSEVVAAAELASGTLGTAVTLDLRTKFGAWLIGRVGRKVTTALTRSGYIQIRPTQNDTVVAPTTVHDLISSTAVTTAGTTLSAGATIADTTVSVASSAGIAIGDTVCLSGASGARIEFCRVAAIGGSTITLEEPLKVAHNSGDAFVTGADVFRAWLPGGDVYRLRNVNNSGQALVMGLHAAVMDSLTTV